MRLIGMLGAVLLASATAEARPWCGKSGLNPTELTICGSQYLRDLDATMVRLYDEAKLVTHVSGQGDWLRARNACGTGYACIESAYLSRISHLRGLADSAKVFNPRPWCNAGRLNLTERTVCGNAMLRDLDAELQYVHDLAAARGEAYGQATWLRQGRDACGGSVSCIEYAYRGRISVLRERLAKYGL
ncbi:hypothetical protein P1J78_03985 [Psychromarinibacter sp. C21-152]|uniref:Lysozyme inhibitor LprI N-terminal domain-containing protein n=1 Tax=Psychromarinibacter sediminicola TaxID=3033385 RepID=A0AAE3NP72_9RHOB|nr:hypothetical protein [Psychromarinibacter sediminicola]MDF0599886.1 hypothetical protein [Psychromarinibacter sediminicola]